MTIDIILTHKKHPDIKSFMNQGGGINIEEIVNKYHLVDQIDPTDYSRHHYDLLMKFIKNRISEDIKEIILDKES